MTAASAQHDVTPCTTQAQASGRPISRALTKADDTIFQAWSPAAIRPQCCCGTTFCTYSVQTSAPNQSAVAATSTAVVTTAEAMTRQRPVNTSITGSSNPNCGLMVRIPN